MTATRAPPGAPPPRLCSSFPGPVSSATASKRERGRESGRGPFLRAWRSGHSLCTRAATFPVAGGPLGSSSFPAPRPGVPRRVPAGPQRGQPSRVFRKAGPAGQAPSTCRCQRRRDGVFRGSLAGVPRAGRRSNPSPGAAGSSVAIDARSPPALTRSPRSGRAPSAERPPEPSGTFARGGRVQPDGGWPRQPHDGASQPRVSRLSPSPTRPASP